MNGYSKQVKAFLTEAGWCLLRVGKGSHEIWGKNGKKVTVSHGCKSKHTANKILKDAGIKNHKI